MILDGLMPHQAQGVHWLHANPRGFLAWQMRCGKTATVLRAWETLRFAGKADPLLVLCPATGRENWRREAIRFAIDKDFPPRVQVIDRTDAKLDPHAEIVVTNYDKLLHKNIRTIVRSRRWGALALDEARALKNSGSERTRVVYPVGKRGANMAKPLIDFADRVWPMDGTPMPNHPGELWTHAYSLWPQSLVYDGAPMEEWKFQLGFCETQRTQHGVVIRGGKNLEELRTRLDPHINRLKLRDVLPDMPPVRVDSWPLSMERISGNLFPSDEGLMEKLSKYGSVDAIEHFDNGTLDAYLACIEAEAVHLATLRKETGTLKAVATALLVADEIEAGAGKTVIFAYHRDAIETLAKGLARFKPAIVHGGTKDRMAEVDRFWGDDTCSVFIGQLKAAGQIIDLSCARNVIFAEADWTPGENEQATFRVLGPKQTEPAFIRFAYLKGSVDEAVNRANARKLATISQVFH